MLEACKHEELGGGEKDHAADYKQLKSLIEDLFELRREKIIRVMKRTNVQEGAAVFLSSIGSTELNYVRPAYTSGISVADRIQSQKDDAESRIIV